MRLWANVDLLQSLTYGNGLILWKNFSADNELYQLIVEQGATQDHQPVLQPRRT